MFCTNCGTEVNDGSKFCPVCGAAMQAQGSSDPTAVNEVKTEAAEETVLNSEISETAGAVIETNEAGAVDDTVNVTDAAAAGAAATAETVTEMSTEGACSEGETAGGSPEGESVTAQYARRIEEQKQAQYGGYVNGAGNQQFSSQQTQNNGYSGGYNSNQQTQTGSYGQFDQGQGNNNFYGAPNQGQQFNVPQPKNSLATAGCVLCIIALVLAFFQLLGVLGGIFGIFACAAEEGFAGFIFGAGTLVIKLIKLAGLLVSSLVMYLVWKKWDDSKAEPLMVGALTGGAVLVLTVILRGIFVAFFNGVVFGYTYDGAFSGAFLSTVFAIAMMVITYVFISEKHINPFMGLQGNIAEGMKRNFKAVSEMAVEAKNEYQAGKGQGANAGANVNGNAYNNVNQNAAPGNMNPVNGQPGNFVSGPLSTDRSIVAYILLGLVTCGIYGLYTLHCMIKDVNVTCAGDGKNTPGILEYILFGILTCGIYDYFWLYNFGNRISENAPRYGMNFQENGTTILLWWIFGILLCGVGPYVAIYILIKNTNALNQAYNQMMFRQNQ